MKSNSVKSYTKDFSQKNTFRLIEIQNRKLLSKQLEKESKLVREESMKVLAEFENIT